MHAAAVFSPRASQDHRALGITVLPRWRALPILGLHELPLACDLPYSELLLIAAV
jgi:hypothetical protein